MSEPALTAQHVHDVMADCISAVGIDVEGIVRTFRLDPLKLANHTDEITAMLCELPSEFRISGGGGWSFLQACMRSDGHQWGEHHDMESLFVLGMGIDKVKCQLPRDLWPALPGGMPYYGVDV